ncbi:putative beta-carotene desaturase/methylase, partial [Streptomyces sparsogenes DSM 40356]
RPRGRPLPGGTRGAGHAVRARGAARRAARGLAGAAGRRLPGDHEPGLPRLLPAVLQPARPAAARRPAAGHAHRAAGLPAAAQLRPVRELRPGAAHPAAQRPGLRRAQPQLRPARPGADAARRRAAAAGRARAGGVRTAGRRQRVGLPGARPLPRGRASPGVHGVLPELLRRPARTVRRRAGADVPHLLPRLRRGAAVRRGPRALPAGPLGAARPPPRGPGGTAELRHAGGERGARARRRAAGHRRRRDPPLRRGRPGAGHRRAAAGGGRLAPAGHRPVAGGRRTAAHRTAVPGVPAVAGPAGGARPPRVPRHRRLRPAGQRQRPGALGGRGRPLGRPQRRLGGRTARVRPRPGRRPGGRAGPAPRPTAPRLPGDPGCADRRLVPRVAGGLPAVPGGRPRRPAHGPHPGPGRGPGRRPGPHRPSGGADGARGHHRIPRRQRPARALGREGRDPVDRPRQGALRTAARLGRARRALTARP